MNASNQVVVKKFIKALPDEIMRVIYSFALPVKPKVCDVCKTPCVKTHLLKSITGHLDRSSIIKGNLCNTCWCSRINYATIIKYNFLEKLEKHLYPTDTVIKEELKKHLIKEPKKTIRNLRNLRNLRKEERTVVNNSKN